MLHCFNPFTPADLKNSGEQVMRAMFAARKSVFVDLLKWDVPVIAGRYEIDQFDNKHATYLVLADSDGGHIASARLLPTTRPHILDSFYADLCALAPPRGPTICEVTRFCIDRSLNRNERRQARDILVHTLANHALAHGITAYTAIAQAGWCDQIERFGWRCKPLGKAKRVHGERLAAVRIDIDANTPHLLAQAGIGGAHQKDTRMAAIPIRPARCICAPGHRG